MLGGALEHQMFEKMREARFAGRLVGGADLVPDHLRDHRRAVIRDHHDLQAIGEGERGGRLGGHGGLGEGVACGEGQCGEQRGEKRTAKRNGDIMTCLAALANGAPRLRRNAAQNLRWMRAEPNVRDEAAASGPRGWVERHEAGRRTQLFGFCRPRQRRGPVGLLRRFHRARCRRGNSATASGSRSEAGSAISRVGSPLNGAASAVLPRKILNMPPV